MPSPFPGMNPYLEKPYQWAEVHGSFLLGAKAALAAQLRGRYFVHYDQTVYLREVNDDLTPYGRPDLAIARRDDGVPAAAGTATLDAPERIELVDAELDEFRQGFLEIVDPASREVVTVIELLSPANKATGGDRDRYLEKRRRHLTGPAHFIEIDLLRGGPRLPIDKRRKKYDYYVLVSRAELRPKVDLWRLRLRDPLPVVPVPLKAGDADATLDLKAILDRLYDESTLPDEIYLTPPDPRLAPDDAAWAAQFVPKQL
ncbi:MAG: DUF4058 family protein [Gemmataceae bacterium]